MSHRYELQYESYEKKISYSMSWDHDTFHLTHISTMREAKIKEFYERDTRPRWNRYGAMAVSHASETKDSHSRQC